LTKKSKNVKQKNTPHWNNRPTMTVLLYFLTLATLFYLAICDGRHLLLPDRFLGLFGILSCILKGLDVVFLSFYAIFTFLGISWGLRTAYRWYTGRDGLGGGDVKFLSLSGLWVSFEHIPLFLFMIGLGGYLGGKIWHRLGQGAFFPLGVVIAAVLSGWIVEQGLR
jgi:leader peptidase (prepilin peptidase)/N-methyltransferase